MTNTSFYREWSINVYKTLSVLVPVPDESPRLPINTHLKELMKQHCEFNAVESLLKVKDAHIIFMHSQPLTDVPGNDFLFVEKIASAQPLCL